MRHIVILVHRHGSLVNQTYFMRDIAGLWREAGHTVAVAQGPDLPVDADLAVNHVDLTVTPDDHREYLRRHPTVVNGRVTDISKRRISRLLLRPGDPFDGPVIIKANRNSGGMQESNLARRGLLPASQKSYVREYVVLESSAEVTPDVWEHPDLVVERFEPEVVDGCFCARIWMFLGDRELGFRYYSRHPIVKGPNVFRREPLSDVPDDLRRIRQELGFDFGTFDYGIVEGRTVLYDVNRTPITGTAITDEQRRERVRILAEGLRAFA